MRRACPLPAVSSSWERLWGAEVGLVYCAERVVSQCVSQEAPRGTAAAGARMARTSVFMHTRETHTPQTPIPVAAVGLSFLLRNRSCLLL